MPGSRSDRILDEWRAVAQTVRRPEPRRGLTVRSPLPLAMGSVGLVVVLFVALVISQRPASTGPGPAASAVSPTGAAAPSAASASATPAEELPASVIASIPGIWSTGCTFQQPAATDGALWLVREGETSLVRIDTTTNQVVAEIPLGIGPSPQIVAADGAVWVAPDNCDTGSAPPPMVVKRVDPATDQVDAAIPFDAQGTIVPGASDVLVTLRTSPYTTYQIDPVTSTAHRVFDSDVGPIAACSALWAVVGNADGTRVFVTRLDPATGTAAASFSVEAATIESLNAVDGECWAVVPIEASEPVVPAPADLVLIDASLGEVARSPRLPSIPVALGGAMWLRDIDPVTQTSTIQRIDPRTGGAAGPRWTLPAGAGSAGLWYANGSIWAQVGSTMASAALVRLDVAVEEPVSTSTPAATDEPGATEPVQGSPSLSPGEFAVPTDVPNGVGGGDALLTGILGGTTRNGGGCLWLDELAPNGSVAGRASIIWPYGYRAFADPLRIVGPDGKTIATVGDRIEMGGGGPPIDYVPTPAQDPCGLGHVVGVSSVVSVNGR